MNSVVRNTKRQKTKCDREAERAWWWLFLRRRAGPRWAGFVEHRGRRKATVTACPKSGTQEDIPRVNLLRVWAKLEMNLTPTKKTVREIAGLWLCHKIRWKRERKYLWRICRKVVFTCVYT